MGQLRIGNGKIPVNIRFGISNTIRITRLEIGSRVSGCKLISTHLSDITSRFWVSFPYHYCKPRTTAVAMIQKHYLTK